MNLGRRSLLKFMGAAPAVAAAATPMMAAQAAGYGVVGAGALAGYAEAPTTGLGVNNARTFLDFASWLKDCGESQMREQARYVQVLDPDIAMMAVPLNTKVIWQRERKYRALLEERKNWFSRTLKQDGHVQWWG